MKMPPIGISNSSRRHKTTMPKAPKLRSFVYTPSGKQMNKGSFVSVPKLKFPKIKIKSDN